MILPCLGLENQCTTKFCVCTPTPCDQGNGKWNDQNYVLLAPDYLDIEDPGTVEIYYKDEKQDLVFHAKENGNYIWGISTKWAYLHPGWKDEDNWEIYFD